VPRYETLCGSKKLTGSSSHPGSTRRTGWLLARPSWPREYARSLGPVARRVWQEGVQLAARGLTPISVLYPENNPKTYPAKQEFSVFESWGTRALTVWLFRRGRFADLGRQDFTVAADGAWWVMCVSEGMGDSFALFEPTHESASWRNGREMKALPRSNVGGDEEWTESLFRPYRRRAAITAEKPSVSSRDRSRTCRLCPHDRGTIETSILRITVVTNFEAHRSDPSLLRMDQKLGRWSGRTYEAIPGLVSLVSVSGEIGAIYAEQLKELQKARS